MECRKVALHLILHGYRRLRALLRSLDMGAVRLLAMVVENDILDIGNRFLAKNCIDLL
jgi:hypothetical protein